MAFEIDVEEESDLLVRETFFWPEETALNGLGTRSSERGQHPVLVTGMKRADFNRTAVAEMFEDRIFGGSRHEIMFPRGQARRWAGLIVGVRSSVAMLDLDQTLRA